MRTACAKAKESNMVFYSITEYQTFLEEGKFVVSVTSVACVVSRCYPIFNMISDTFMYTTFS